MPDTDPFIKGLSIGMSIGAATLLLYMILSPDYRQGQIDALNGVIKYELLKHDDGATTWELIDA